MTTAIPTTSSESLPAWLRSDGETIAAKLSDIAFLDHKGVAADDTEWTNMVSSAARAIKWGAFPNRRAAIVDWFDRQSAKHDARVAEWSAAL